jgi:hypothetical protein
MVKKCANPRCSEPFLHLAQGRLFAVRRESRSPINSNSGDTSECSDGWECFWLCDRCAETMTVAIDRKHVVRVIALASKPLKPTA